MNKKTILLLHRLWGLSMGLFIGLFDIDKLLWIRIVIIIPWVYFMIFGDSHFKENKNE